MSKKFDMEFFLDNINLQESLTYIDEVIYRWNGNNWSVLKDREGEALALAWLRENAPDTISKATAKSAWETLKLDLLTKLPTLPAKQTLIPCQGAYVIVKEDGELVTLPPSKDTFCTYSLACSYDPSAVAPRFAEFFEQTLPDETLRARVQEFVGYTLLPDHRYQRAAMWLGTGANGKGVLSNIVQALHKEVAAIKVNNHSRFAMSGVLNASLLVDDELPFDGLDEARLKSMIAGEPIFIDIKGQDPITTRVRGKLLTLGNNFPKIRDCSEGFWRRWEVIPFNTEVPESMRDPMLAETIIREELTGVLNWALEGLQRLLRRGGFEPNRPMAMAETLKEAKRVADDVAGWISDRVMTMKGPLTTHKADVYADYRRWCVDNDHAPQSPQGFWLKLKGCRMDLATKKIRVGSGTLNACSIVLRPHEDEFEAAANGDFFVQAA
jgi:putative DNA primase/helicase